MPLRSKARLRLQARSPGAACAEQLVGDGCRAGEATARSADASREEAWAAASSPRMSPSPHSTSTTVLENEAEASGAYLAHSLMTKNVPTTVTNRSTER